MCGQHEDGKGRPGLRPPLMGNGGGSSRGGSPAWLRRSSKVNVGEDGSFVKAPALALRPESSQGAQRMVLPVERLLLGHLHAGVVVTSERDACLLNKVDLHGCYFANVS